MLRKHAIFILILAFAAASRSALLCLSQTHVHSDEAIIGLMGKHISEGRYFPFYMYGQYYNAGAAWEAYVAAIPFTVFGPDAILLKGCIVVLSLLCLVLFYRLACSLYGQRTAELAALIFALTPSLLKWHFQVRGYAWYFLSIPILTGLFFSVRASSGPKAKRFFVFGLVSGLTVWGLELALPWIAALWFLLALRGKWTAREIAAGAIGFGVGYAPAIVFNFTHQFINWAYVFGSQAGHGGLLHLFEPSTVGRILFEEMPKFFGPDTVLWYYPEIPAIGMALYGVALLTVAVAAFPFLKAPGKILPALRGESPDADENKDLILLALVAASFVPYLVAPIRVPGYFLGGCFFLSLLTARFVARCFSSPAKSIRVLGGAVLTLVVTAGIGALIQVGKTNQVETLTLEKSGTALKLAPFPGKDIEAVQNHLFQNRIPAVWTTFSFVYPLVFESDETLVVSDELFSHEPPVYPRTVPWRVPTIESCGVFVIETDSPLRPSVEARCQQATGLAPRVSKYGTLTVIERRETSLP
jgi:hypothetical protein